MARLKNGILGGVSGTVGTVVGYRWRGKDYVRSKPRPRTSPPTKKEQKNREKFAYTQQWLQPLIEFLRVGFKDYHENYEGFVAAKSYNAKHALIGFSPYFQIDPSKAVLSYGDMDRATDGAATAEVQDYITFRWTGGNFTYDDRAMLVAYDITGEVACFNTASERADGGYARLKLPEEMRGKQVDVYLAFVSEDRKRRSISQYLGLVTAL